MRAVGRDAKPRQAAEILVGGFEHQTAAEGQCTEPRFLRVARIEALDRLGVDFDAVSREIGDARRLRHRRDQRERQDGCEGRGAGQVPLQEKPLNVFRPSEARAGIHNPCANNEMLRVMDSGFALTRALE
jgi:hypothetical protein